mmetsp:Transcript_4174/g.12227  ORF Transcript_4174/g.12227 Transcript_4174/m.12227 type:complete len:207 (+) Transcript_4174:1354-1974(+)
MPAAGPGPSIGDSRAPVCAPLVVGANREPARWAAVAVAAGDGAGALPAFDVGVAEVCALWLARGVGGLALPAAAAVGLVPAARPGPAVVLGQAEVQAPSGRCRRGRRTRGGRRRGGSGAVGIGHVRVRKCEGVGRLVELAEPPLVRLFAVLIEHAPALSEAGVEAPRVVQQANVEGVRLETAEIGRLPNDVRVGDEGSYDRAPAWQ